jgi:hypothetical protein
MNASRFSTRSFAAVDFRLDLSSMSTALICGRSLRIGVLAIDRLERFQRRRSEALRCPTRCGRP